MELEEAIENLKTSHITSVKIMKQSIEKLLDVVDEYHYLIENSISKKKIEDKIDELKKEKYILSSRDAEIRLLQELLEEK